MRRDPKCFLWDIQQAADHRRIRFGKSFYADPFTITYTNRNIKLPTSLNCK